MWDDGRWTALPSLGPSDEVAADVCVVGLGAAGLAAVAEVLRSGASVAGVDAGEVGGGASGRNGGFLLAGAAAFHHQAIRTLGRSRAVELYRLTLDEIDRACAETPDSVRRVGSVRLASSGEEAADCDAQLAAMRADDLPVEPYEGPEGRGLLFPRDGSLQPLDRCRTLAVRVVAAGARLFEHSPVADVRGDAVVVQSGARVRCGAVVVAVDGGLERLLPELALRVRTARAQMLATAPAPEVSIPRPVYARWGWDYWQQLADGRVVLGGFRDRGGEGEWSHDAVPSDAVQRELETFLREALHVRAPITHRWAGTIAFTDDRMPVLEQVRPNVWAAGAYSGTGNVIGPLCGRAAVQLALTGSSALASPFCA